jgi:hypothetical protein
MNPNNIDIAALHPMNRRFSVLGRVNRRKLKWAGQFVCSVQTSIGELVVHGNRDVLLQVEEGSWLALRLLRHDQGVQVQAIEQASPRLPAAWLPSVPCAQPAILQRLRSLLGRLTPAGQALFMSVMAGGKTQLRFFTRAAALDHHTLQGGLFEQSVLAAELAFDDWHPTESDRECAALAALLYDIGKLADPHVGLDLQREGPDVEPHPLTRLRVLPACDLVEQHDRALATTVRCLLVPGPGDVDPALYQRVRRAVERSWLGRTV